MKHNRPLLPGFLKKIDNRLLVDHPAIWTARTHLVLYYGFIFMLALAILSFIDRTDVRFYSPGEYWVGFTIIICIVALTVWLIYVLRFNVFKRYGQINPWHLLTCFLLYFIATGTIILFPYVYPVVETIKANRSYSSRQIVSDINTINLNINKLEYDALDHNWRKDTIIIDDSIGTTPEYARTETTSAAYANRRRMSNAVLLTTYKPTDSLIRINDSTYVYAEPPPYPFVTVYRAAAHTQEQLLTAKDIYDSIIRNYRPSANKSPIEAQTRQLTTRYIYDTTTIETEATSMGEEKINIFGRIRNKYMIYEVEEGLNNILAKKERFSTSYLPSHIRLFYYFTLFISLLVVTFRFSTRKTFFLGLLSVVIISILTAIIMSMTRSGIVFFSLLIFYSLLFLALSITAWTNRSRKLITGIAGNLFVYSIPLLPRFIYNLVTEIQRKNLPEDQYLEWYDRASYYPVYADLAGGLLLLILLATYLQKFYRRWYSLPEL